MHKILIGGRALAVHGSNRVSLDYDYLVFVENDKTTFLHNQGDNKDEDWINANGHPFFNIIYETEKESLVASKQGLLELKAFAFVQHCLNRNWQKANDAEYDIKFLCRAHPGLRLQFVQKHITLGQMYEIEKVIKQVANEKLR